MEDFEAARDRVLMGQRRESMVLSDEEKELIAYHEGGHAVLRVRARARRPAAQGHDPPHRAWRSASPSSCRSRSATSTSAGYIEDSLVVRLGGRVAEELVFGAPVHRRQQRPRRRHRARPQDGARVGHERPHRPDGVGLAGRRCSSARTSCTPATTPTTTARVIDEEVERILRDAEARADVLLKQHREGLTV